MSDESDGAGLAEVEQNFAINVREYREQSGLSQEDLAQRMAERGFGFTQATVWKIMELALDAGCISAKKIGHA